MIAVRRVVIAAALIGACVGLTGLIVCLALRQQLEPSRAAAGESIAPIPPPPRLQAHPGTDLAELRDEKRAALEGWGWADDAQQFARIPIERAMAIYVAKPRAVAAAQAAANAGGKR